MSVMQEGPLRAAHMIKLTATREITPYPWSIRTRKGSSHPAPTA
jgi:hypothetical protein